MHKQVMHRPGLRLMAGSIAFFVAAAMAGPVGAESDTSPNDAANWTPSVPEGGGESLAANGITSENLPRLDGSTSTQPLQALIHAAVTGEALQWHAYMDGTRRLLSLFEPDAEYIAGPRGPHGPFNPRKTHGAYKAIITGEADLALIARKPIERELELASERGVELDVRPVAMDGMVFVVHADNPLESVTLAQLREVYTDGITEWSQLGVEPERMNADSHHARRSRVIRIPLRNPESASQVLFEKLVMRGEPIQADIGRTLVLMGMGFIASEADVPPGTLAYTVHYYERHMLNRDEQRASLGSLPKRLAINGVAPSPETIADGTYPLVEPVYLVTRLGIDEHEATAQLRDWLLSEDGQALVAASGYVPLTAAASR